MQSSAFDYSHGRAVSHEPMTSYEAFGDEVDYLDKNDIHPFHGPSDSLWFEDVEEDEDIERCEADTRTGGVCLTRLKGDNCPNKNNHYDWFLG